MKAQFLLGRSEVSRDSKDRIALKKAMNATEGEIIYTLNFQNHIDLCREGEYLDNYLESLKKLNKKITTERDQKKLDLERLEKMLYFFDENKVDKSGRIAISPFLIKTHFLEKRLVLIGSIDHLEIWNPPLLEEFENEITNKQKQLSLF